MAQYEPIQTKATEQLTHKQAIQKEQKGITQQGTTNEEQKDDKERNMMCFGKEELCVTYPELSIMVSGIFIEDIYKTR